MSALRDAAQAVVDSAVRVPFEREDDDDGPADGWCVHPDALDALRAALAETAEPSPADTLAVPTPAPSFRESMERLGMPQAKGRIALGDLTDEEVRRAVEDEWPGDPAPDAEREAADALLAWHDTTHGNEFGHDHHCPLSRRETDPARCTCGWSAFEAADGRRR